MEVVHGAVSQQTTHPQNFLYFLCSFFSVCEMLRGSYCAHFRNRFHELPHHRCACDGVQREQAVQISGTRSTKTQNEDGTQDGHRLNCVCVLEEVNEFQTPLQCMQQLLYAYNRMTQLTLQKYHCVGYLIGHDKTQVVKLQIFVKW